MVSGGSPELTDGMTDWPSIHRRANETAGWIGMINACNGEYSGSTRKQAWPEAGPGRM
jgi:hypothetical protein